jgi:hypothetical protein
MNPPFPHREQERSSALQHTTSPTIAPAAALVGSKPGHSVSKAHLRFDVIPSFQLNWLFDEYFVSASEPNVELATASGEQE